MLELIAEAQAEVLFENFIFRRDQAGPAFAAALIERAQNEVAVRVVHDPFGCLSTLRWPIGSVFRGSRVQVRVYNPPRATWSFIKWGRDHRKLVVQDRERLVAGGLCIADVWAGNCVKQCTWRDSALLVNGEAATGAAADFDQMWGRSKAFTRSRLTKRQQAAKRALAACGDVPVRILADKAGEHRVEQAKITVFNAAREEILITNSYFVPTRAVVEVLLDAQKRGIDVRVLMPHYSNHHIVGWLPIIRSANCCVPASALGAGMDHDGAMTVVVDRCWPLIGSSNVDVLSLEKKAEFNVEVHGLRMGEQMSAVFERDCRWAVPYEYGEWRQRRMGRRMKARPSFALRKW